MIGRHIRLLERFNKSSTLPTVVVTKEELIKLLVDEGKSTEEAERTVKFATILGSEVVVGNQRVKLKPLA